MSISKLLYMLEGDGELGPPLEPKPRPSNGKKKKPGRKPKPKPHKRTEFVSTLLDKDTFKLLKKFKKPGISQCRFVGDLIILGIKTYVEAKPARREKFIGLYQGAGVGATEKNIKAILDPID